MGQRLLFYVWIMLLSPAWGLYQAFQSSDRKLKRWALIAFITLFGSIIMLVDSQDGAHHWSRVYEHYIELDFGQFLVELKEIMLLQTNPETDDDPFIHILSYFLGSIINLPGLFFVFVAFIYAYFMSGALFRLFKQFPKYSNGILFFGLAIVFLIWKNIDGINTVRTWTGMWILFYSCLSYYQTGKKKYIWLMFVPPLIHIGFAVMAIPAWVVLVFGVRKWTYAVIFGLSFITTILNPGAVVKQLQQTETGESKVVGYYRPQEITLAENYEFSAARAWHKRLFRLGVQNWAMVVVAASLLLFGTYFRDMNNLEAHIFSIGLLLKALSNSSWFISALHARSGITAGLFLLAPILLLWQRGYFHKKDKKRILQKKMLSLALIMFIPFVVYKAVDLVYFLSVFILIAPFIPWVDPDWNISIRAALGNLVGR